jgi:hypothetical protein
MHLVQRFVEVDEKRTRCLGLYLGHPITGGYKQRGLVLQIPFFQGWWLWWVKMDVEGCGRKLIYGTIWYSSKLYGFVMGSNCYYRETSLNHHMNYHNDLKSKELNSFRNEFFIEVDLEQENDLPCRRYRVWNWPSCSSAIIETFCMGNTEPQLLF